VNASCKYISPLPSTAIFSDNVPFTKEKTVTHGAKKTPIIMNRKTTTKHHDIGSSVSKTCFWIIRFDDPVNK
jgi:hypothetical protein